jgi:hypothetical protein
MHRALLRDMRFERSALKAQAEALGLDVPRFLDDLELGTFSWPAVQHRAGGRLGSTSHRSRS